MSRMNSNTKVKVSMNRIKRNMRSCIFVLLSLYLVLLVYFAYTLFMYSDRWFADPGNTRVKVDMSNPRIIPGRIYDRNMLTLVETGTKTEDNGQVVFYRKYHELSRCAAHVIGNRQLGIGAETRFIKYLLGYDNNLIERVYQKAFLNREQGNNIILTIDIELQRYADEALGDRSGSIVLINPKNGEILAMVSHPDFDPSDPGKDMKNESLVNKAIYGKYPPGSIMKLITAAAAISHLEGAEEFTLECKGRTDIDGISVSCYSERAHGLVDMNRALEVSCNAYFAKLAVDLGWKNLRSIAERFGFNRDFIFEEVITTKSVFPTSGTKSTEELAWAGVGQDEVLVSPLHMALIASSIANDGKMPEPKLIHGIQRRNGSIVYKSGTKTALNTVPTEIAQALKGMMINAVEEGTGKKAYKQGIEIAGKTGTAEVGNGSLPHAWFIGFAPAEDPSIAIAVIIERAGSGGSEAAPVAGDLISRAIRLGY